MPEILSNFILMFVDYLTVQIPEQWAIAPLEMRFVLIGLLAGMLGSFINMAVWRIPRRESIIWPRSHCPVCKHVLGFWDLVPVISYIFLRGRCRYCEIKFGIRYALIELSLVVSAVLLYSTRGLEWITIVAILLLGSLIFVVGLLQSKRMDAHIIDHEINQVESANNFSEEFSVPKAETSTLFKRNGFTYLEVIITMIIVAAVIIPFGNIFLSSYGRVLKNKEYVMAFNLLEEKMEELKLVPFSKLNSDWFVYARPSEIADSIYAANYSEHYLKMRDDRAYFEKNFSDIMTNREDLPRLAMDRYLKAYKNQYGMDYQFYPEDYKIFKRLVIVQPVESSLNEKFDRIETQVRKNGSGRQGGKDDLLKITVQVKIESRTNSRTLQLSRYRRK